MVCILCKFDLGIIFISHDKIEVIRRASGIEVSKITSTLTGQASGVISPLVDIIAYYSYSDSGKRQLYVKGDDLIVSGNRLRSHFTKTKIIPMGDSEEESYINFLKAFNNEEVKRKKKSNLKFKKKTKKKKKSSR